MKPRVVTREEFNRAVEALWTEIEYQNTLPIRTSNEATTPSDFTSLARVYMRKIEEDWALKPGIDPSVIHGLRKVAGIFVRAMIYRGIVDRDRPGYPQRKQEASNSLKSAELLAYEEWSKDKVGDMEIARLGWVAGWLACLKHWEPKRQSEDPHNFLCIEVDRETLEQRLRQRKPGEDQVTFTTTDRETLEQKQRKPEQQAFDEWTRDNVADHVIHVARGSWLACLRYMQEQLFWKNRREVLEDLFKVFRSVPAHLPPGPARNMPPEPAHSKLPFKEPDDALVACETSGHSSHRLPTPKDNLPENQNVPEYPEAVHVLVPVGDCLLPNDEFFQYGQHPFGWRKVSPSIVGSVVKSLETGNFPTVYRRRISNPRRKTP